jgi:hypothetical protein
MAHTNQINDRAMLVALTIRSWSARKHDKRVTSEVADREHAENSAGRYNKRLLPKEALSFMQSKASAARLEHYKRTLPWSDDGPRILSSSGYFDYTNNIRQLKSDFEQAADDFTTNYPKFVEAAKRTLGNMYKAEDYPDASVIRDKFAIELTVLPMPSSDDFRAKLPQAEIDKIKEDIEKATLDALKLAQNDVFSRAKDALERMVNSLSGYQPPTDDKRAKGAFKNTMVTNIQELVQLIPSLNITNDERIIQLMSDLNNLSDVEPEELRKFEKVRNDTAKEAQFILDKVSSFLA